MIGHIVLTILNRKQDLTMTKGISVGGLSSVFSQVFEFATSMSNEKEQAGELSSFFYTAFVEWSGVPSLGAALLWACSCWNPCC